ncbi:hypothetical protein N9V24_05305 [Pseudomonadota bacterium]|nr:hypothetical protein [Pseudomonadota bacterium]
MKKLLTLVLLSLLVSTDNIYADDLEDYVEKTCSDPLKLDLKKISEKYQSFGVEPDGTYVYSKADLNKMLKEIKNSPNILTLKGKSFKILSRWESEHFVSLASECQQILSYALEGEEFTEEYTTVGLSVFQVTKKGFNLIFEASY